MTVEIGQIVSLVLGGVVVPVIEWAKKQFVWMSPPFMPLLVSTGLGFGVILGLNSILGTGLSWKEIANYTLLWVFGATGTNALLKTKQEKKP